MSVAEQSADEHAADLIQAYRRRRADAAFSGLAGPAMRAAGCTGYYDMTARSAMAGAAFARVPEAVRLLRRLKGWLDASRFDAAVMVDSPALNLPIAKLCRRRGIPVLYYIAPQTWAWASWRVRRVRNRVDALACILPFEEAYFREHGLTAEYVGHPTFDRLMSTTVDQDRVAELRGSAQPLVVLMPGSREHVVREVLPGQLEVAQALKTRHPKARFLIVPANETIRQMIDSRLRGMPRSDRIDLLPGPGDRAAAICAADLVLVASGTATLEVAYYQTPMIVMYNASRWAYLLLGRWVISTPYLSLPNIIAGREVVPEFMPYYRTTDPIIARAVEWLGTPGALERVRRELAEVAKPLQKRGAAEHAARMLDGLIARGG